MWGTARQQLKRHRCRFQVTHFNGLDDFPKTCTPHRALEKECGHYGKAWAEVKQISVNCEWRHVGVVDACTIPHQWLNGDHILHCSITVLYHVVLGRPIRWQSKDSESHCMPPLAVELSSFLNMWHIHYHLYLLINTPYADQFLHKLFPEAWSFWEREVITFNPQKQPQLDIIVHFQILEKTTKVNLVPLTRLATSSSIDVFDVLPIIVKSKGF